MSGEMAASLVLKFTDQGSSPAQQALKKITNGMKETGEAAKTASTAAMSAFKKLADSREILGIRSEKAIQNEIKQTEAAYKRLAESGQAGARELGRAQDAMRQKVAGLRKELDGVKSSAGGAGSALSKAGALFGAGVAAKMILQGPVSRTMDYSMEMAHSANTLYAGRSVAERVAGKVQINDAVMAGVRASKGGVSREDALAGVKTLGASGEYGDDPRAAFALLPTLTKAAAANNASVVDMANIAIKAKSTMGLTNASRVLDMAAQGGIEGQFELRDMAKWLPQQMAYAKRAGLQGESGFATLVAGNQLSMTTAGTADDAGNNFKNLLAKVNSNDTAIDAKKMGIDLSGALAAAQAKGVGGLDAFLNLTEQVAAKDSRLVKLREQAKGAKGGDLKANLQAQTDILEGSSIGKLVQDQQALGSLVAILNGREKFDSIRNKAMGANGTNDDLLQVVSNEPGAKAQLAAAESANAMQTALDRVNPLLGSMADSLSGMMQNFPVLSAVVSGAALGGRALGSAALTARGLSSLFGFGGAGTAAGATAAATGASGSWSAGQLAAGSASAAFGLAPLALMAAVTKWAGNPNDTLGSSESDHGRTTSLMGFSDSLSKLFEGIGIRFGPGSRPQEPVEQPVREPIHVVVDVKNGNIVAAVNEANARNATRH